MHVDGAPIAAQGSVLDACRNAKANVPTHCKDERLQAGGHCRGCIVEIDGRYVAACTTPARAGMHVLTETPRLLAYREHLGTLVEQEKEERAARSVARASVVNRSTDESHPYLRIDLDKCTLCRLCVRACADLQGQFVFAVKGRGAESELTWGGGAFSETDCVSCGACASACPTGAISDIDRARLKGDRALGRTVRTTCSYCGVGCQLDAHVSATGDDVVQIDGAASSVNHGHLCVKGRYAHGFTRHKDRLRSPLLRKGGVLTEVGWDEALDYAAREIGRLRGSMAGLSSSRCTNEENYLVQKWMRAGLGTNHVDCCARVCHAPSAAGLRRAFGTGAATNSLADIERSDLLFVAGSNATESHPITGARVKQAVLRGAKLVVVDPRRTELASIADVHLMLRPGTNVPLLNSLAAVLVLEDLVDHEFIEARTEGFAAYAAFVRAFTPEATEAVTGVAAADVRLAARMLATARAPMQLHGLGMTEHVQGSESVMLLCNLALLCGAVGSLGVGVNPLRGQNNVQGAADMGCQPDLLPGYAPVTDTGARARFETAWGRPMPAEAGLTLPRMYEAIDTGVVRGMYLLGEDVVATDPDASVVARRLGALELLIVQELFLSETAKLAHLVLPGASFLEKDGTFTNGERRIQRVRKAIDPPGGARADWEILCDLMTRTGMPQSFASPAAIWDELRTVVPAFRGASYARLEGDGLQWPVPSEDHDGTPTLHVDQFVRGRAAFSEVAFRPSPALASTRPLQLITGRVLAHYNSGSMTRRSANVALAPHDALEMHPKDALARGIRDGDRVVVLSDYGEAHVKAFLTDSVREGTLFLSFHFPESGTNRVTSDLVDGIADTPEYKLTAVDVRLVD